MIDPHLARMPLPKRQAELLAYIDRHLSDSGRMPTFDEMAAAMGWKQSASAVDCVSRLIWRGRMRWKFEGRNRVGLERIESVAQ